MRSVQPLRAIDEEHALIPQELLGPSIGAQQCHVTVYQERKKAQRIEAGPNCAYGHARVRHRKIQFNST
jgi:hypothetical protein